MSGHKLRHVSRRGLDVINSERQEVSSCRGCGSSRLESPLSSLEGYAPCVPRAECLPDPGGFLERSSSPFWNGFGGIGGRPGTLSSGCLIHESCSRRTARDEPRAVGIVPVRVLVGGAGLPRESWPVLSVRAHERVGSLGAMRGTSGRVQANRRSMCYTRGEGRVIRITFL